MGEGYPSDKVILSGMAFHGYHGVKAAEKEVGQRLLVDVDMEKDLHLPGRSDDLKDTINYSAVYLVVRAVIEGKSRNLLECLAQEIADRLLAEFPTSAVRVRLTKPSPPIRGAAVGAASVEVWRGRC